jgi:hypothetical protein
MRDEIEANCAPVRPAPIHAAEYWRDAALLIPPAPTPAAVQPDRAGQRKPVPRSLKLNAFYARARQTTRLGVQ